MLILREIIALTLWSYAIAKLFIFDVDNYIIQNRFPELAWLLHYKFFILLGVFAASLVIFKKKNVFIWCVFFLFYPFVLLFWKIPNLLLQQKSWIVIFGALTIVGAFVRSFRINIILAATMLISGLLIFITDHPIVQLVLSVVLFAALLFVYSRTIRAAFKSGDLRILYQDKLPEIRSTILLQYKLDEDIRGLSHSNLSEVQQKKWATKAEVPVLLNRVYLFVGRRFREYQRSPAPFVLAAVSFFGLLVLTLLVFSCLNLSIYKVDKSGFEISNDPSFFTFVWYSFNAFVNNFIKEVVPSKPLSQSIWMINAMFSLVLLTVLGSLYFSIKSQRKSQEVDFAIAAIESEGRELEAFIKSEYKIESVEAAVTELERLEASLLKLFLWLTKNIK